MQLSSAPTETVADPAGPGGNTSPKRVTFGTVLRNRNFRNLWLGQIISQVGDYFSFLALMVVVSGFSDDAATTTRNVSGMMIAVTLPRLFFGVLAGVFVDRWDRRRTMLSSDLLRALLTLLLIPAFVAKDLWLVYALGFILSTVGTFFGPAKSALIPNLVPADQLIAANSLSQTSSTLAFFAGPALAGLTFKLVGNGNEWVAFVIDSVSFVVSALTIWLIAVPKAAAHAPSVPAEGVSPLRKVWDEVIVGLKALTLNRTMAALSVVFAITMLGVGALNVLWVVFLKTAFGYDQSELAWRFSVVDILFFAAMALSSVVCGNFLSHLPPKWFVVGGLVLAGVTTLPLGYLPDYWLLAIANVGIGLGVAPINTGTSTLVQIVVPNSRQGRVWGGIGTISDTASLASMSFAGVLAGMLGIPLVFLLSGVMCVIGGLLALVALPALAAPHETPGDTAEAPLSGHQPVLPEQGGPVHPTEVDSAREAV